MSDLAELSAVELLVGARRRAFSPVEVVDALAARIATVDPGVGAFTTLCLDRAHDEAVRAESDHMRATADGVLAGVPFAAKDIFDSAGVRTAYGSPMFAEHVPVQDATPIRRAREAGGILVGKTQMHEFAWGITSVNPLMGTSRNPWAPERISGGSSGGSAVALATHQVPLALASDTGGSIRVPASLCGVVGLKPTFGRVGTGGSWPLARTLDHPGAMARTPRDAALLLSAVAGVDPRDPATAMAPAPSGSMAVESRLDGVRIGLCPALHLVELSDAVQAVLDSAVGTVERLGARIVEVDLADAQEILPTFITIQQAEALHTHRSAGLFPDRRDEYGDDVRARLEGATAINLDDYLTACKRRDSIRARFAHLLSEVDALLTPIAAGPPPAIGQDHVTHRGRAMSFREFVMSYTVPQDLTGLPTCAVRAGFDELGLPVGVQFTASTWQEQTCLRLAHALYRRHRGDANLVAGQLQHAAGLTSSGEVHP